ncbi:MAG: hypothetical protein LUQ65_03980 [Candidatus Helarchaeota archaeon]|nr:hypothetical protein [Candidatus Helarchaeota archaeon]
MDNFTQQEHAQIVKEEMVREMDMGLDHIQVTLGRMYGGISGWFLNPIARLIYNIMARKDIRDKAINQIDIVLDCAMKYRGGNLDELIEANFEAYITNDQSFHHCKKQHKAYPAIEGIMKEVFKHRIEPAHRLLTSEGTCYEELTQNAFAEKEGALENLQKELEFVSQVMDVIKHNKSALKIPTFVREPIIKIMALGQDYARERLTHRIDEIYEYNGHNGNK